jgi:hypothetical protein
MHEPTAETFSAKLGLLNADGVPKYHSAGSDLHWEDKKNSIVMHVPVTCLEKRGTGMR